MTQTPTGSESSVPELLQRFEQELLQAPDPGAVLERYLSLHPELAEKLRELAEAIEMLQATPFGHAPQDGAARDEATAPTRFGPYRVVRSIGRGGMGEVYEAVEEPLGRRVAVKTIRRSQTTSPSLLLRFDRERRTLARLHHTNIVPILRHGSEEDLLYFAMPYHRRGVARPGDQDGTLARVVGLATVELDVRGACSGRPLAEPVGLGGPGPVPRNSGQSHPE